MSNNNFSKVAIPPAVTHYVDQYIDWLFMPGYYVKPKCQAGIILKEVYDQLPIDLQIKLHIEGVLIIPFFGTVDFPR